jgi:glycosyltransferase involved in cell wall biosynthesis
MRIALLSTCALSTPPKKYGGTELVVAELAKSLLSLGHDVTTYATGDSTVLGQLRYHFQKPCWPPNELAELRHAGFAWNDIAHSTQAFDVVHAHHAAALPYHLILPQHATALTVHHMRVDDLVQHYRSYPDVAYVAISNRQAQLSPDVPFARTIHHGLDPALYSRGEGDGGYVAFLGRFAAEKAPHLAIDAARAAGVRLVLGGTAHEVAESQAYFERELKPRSLASADLTWSGELAHGPKLRLLGGARALLFPLAWEEPFGLVMIEAMLVGTPVIAFARGSAPEVIEDGVTGFLVKNVQEMAQRIRQLDQIDRGRCRARAQERWSSERMARDYVALYEQIAHKASGRVSHTRALAATRQVLTGPAESRLQLVARNGYGATLG